MGVRYNAEKSKVGNYYTTQIFKFRMKCHLCDNHFEIQTDPKASVQLHMYNTHKLVTVNLFVFVLFLCVCLCVYRTWSMLL